MSNILRSTQRANLGDLCGERWPSDDDHGTAGMWDAAEFGFVGFPGFVFPLFLNTLDSVSMCRDRASQDRGPGDIAIGCLARDHAWGQSKWSSLEIWNSLPPTTRKRMLAIGQGGLFPVAQVGTWSAISLEMMQGSEKLASW